MIQIDGPFPVPATFDQDGAPLTFHTSCHVNIAAWDMRAEWEPYRVTPEQPARVFAGDEAPTFEQTVFLRFADEAEMLRVLGMSPPTPGA